MGKNGTGTIVVYTAESDHEYFEVIWHDGSISDAKYELGRMAPLQIRATQYHVRDFTRRPL